MSVRLAPLAICLLAALPALAAAQATVKPDGEFRYAIGAGASYSSGNTSAASANLGADGVRATADSKWRFGGKALWARTDGTTTAENFTLGTEYDQDFSADWFGFGSADYLRDTFANISARYALHSGVGRHLIKADATTFDISGGVGYTEDKYLTAADIHGELRDTYGRAEVVLAEESTHKWTPTTSFHQKVTLFPAISSSGGFRSVLDTGLAVAMTPKLNLTVGFTYRYDSDPGVGFKRSDTLFVTGLSLKIE